MLFKKLKIILQFRYTYIVLFIIALIQIQYNKIEEKPSNEKYFNGTITDYKISENKITFYIQGKDKMIATYYPKEKINNICYGCKIEFEGKLNKTNSNTIPNTFNYKKYLKSKKIKYNITISKIIRIKESKNILYRIKNNIYKRSNRIDKTGYIKSLLLNKKDDLEIYDKYQNIGVSHLFCVSGMHIGIFSTILLKLLKNRKNITKYTIVLTYLLTYSFIIGFTPSIKRCLIFFILSLLNKQLKINVSNIKLLVITTFILIVNNPFIVYDIGFQYSIIAVTSIFLISEKISNYSFIKSSFIISVATFISTMPISLYYYHSINLLSVLYNLIYIPYMTFVLFPLSIITYVLPIFNPLLNATIYCIEILTDVLEKINICTIYLGLNIYQIIPLYLISIIYLKTLNIKLLIFIIFLTSSFKIYPYIDNNIHIYYLDVKQGDSSLIIYKNKATLIDTGGIKTFNSTPYNISKNTITFLHSKGIDKITYLITTHGDYDHMGEAIDLVNNFNVENVIFNCGELNDLEKELIKVLDKKKIKYYSCIKELNIDKYKLQFLNTKEYDNENNNSNVIYFNYVDYKFLFMGDAGIEKENDILNKYNLNNIDFLKVGHHGSNTSSSEYFINKINPKYSLISVGKNNRYGHPKDEVLDALKNSKIYRTDLDGSIEIKLNKNGYKIRTCPP